MRKTKEVTIETANRDKGKRFKITEMSVVAQEKWATKAVLAILNSGFELPEGTGLEDLQGAEGLIKVLKSSITALLKVKYELAQPLYDELLSCCDYLGVGNESISRRLTQETADEVVEEMTTLLILRREALNLNYGFLFSGGN